MPEGDTVFRTAHRLRSALAGKTLTRTDFRVPRYATADLTGGVVDAVRSVGKHLFIDVERPGSSTISIHSHLMMEGVWDVHRAGTRWRRPAHTARVVLRADHADDAEVEAVGFDLGVVELLSRPDEAVAHLGPDLLGDGWDASEAVARLAARPAVPIGIALLDQRNLAGIGNVYRSEICFLKRIHPATPVGDVDLPPVVDIAHRLLVDNRLRAVRSTTGVTARGKELWVYGRQRRPCRRCGTVIERELLGDLDAERSIYVCPRCQPRQTGTT